MPIQFHCPSCRQPIEVDDDYATKPVACPYCRKVVTAPPASTLGNPPVQARPLPRTPPTGQPAPTAGAEPGPMPPQASRLSMVGFGLAGAGLLLFMLGGLASRSFEEYVQKSHQKIEDVYANLQKDVLAGKTPPQFGWWFVGAMALCLSFPLNLSGLVCSLVALFQPTGRKQWAIAGTMFGLILPMLILVAIFGR